jgi:phosphatidylglycerophosphatase A
VTASGLSRLTAAIAIAAGFGALAWTDPGAFGKVGTLTAVGVLLAMACAAGLADRFAPRLGGVATAGRFAHGLFWIAIVAMCLIVARAPSTVPDGGWILGVTSCAALLALGVTLRRVRLALVAIVPALVTLAVARGLSRLLGLEIDALHRVLIPILLGLGVGGATQLVARVEAGEPLAQAWQGSGRAMTGVILTGVVGFGALAFASDPDLASLGKVALVGVGVSLLVCVWIFPLALTVFGLAGPPRPTSSLAEKIVTVGYAGRSAVAPGTVGALQAIPIALALDGTSIAVRAVVCVALTVVSVWFSELYVKEIAKNEGASKDPQNIVIDETVGCLIPMCCVPFEPLWVAAAFVLFRFFDIAKPGPVRWADRGLKGGFGVVMDDVVAGILAAGLLLGARALL